LIKSSLIFLLVVLSAGCSHQSSSEKIAPAAPELTEEAVKPAQIPTACRQFAPVSDIWKLEPILVKQGKIQENMTKAEKELVIREFIRNKNQQFQLCKKGKKS
jgi:hypothetical protein